MRRTRTSALQLYVSLNPPTYRRSPAPLCTPFPQRAQVLKIGSLKKSMTFFENVLGLKVLRHEEFDEGCEATCNGPYGGECDGCRRGPTTYTLLTYLHAAAAIFCLPSPGAANLRYKAHRTLST